jgi:Xaa-Pro aminopeptidase
MEFFMNNREKRLFDALNGKCDAVLVTSDVNRQYFTGFYWTDGLALLTKDVCYCIADFRYMEAARKIVKGYEFVLLEGNRFNVARNLIDKLHITSLGIEDASVSLSTMETMNQSFEGIEMLPVSKEISSIRMAKDDSEIKYIKAAQNVCDEAFKYILGRIKKGMTEREVALDLEFWVRRNGCEATSFDFIVVAGEDSSLPHGVPGDRVIKDGDFLTMDFGGKVHGYCSDMTRTIAVGHVTDEMKKVYDTVLAAQNASFAAIKAGVSGKEVDNAARDLIYKAGYEGCFGHGLGHSVGLEIHEEPRFSPYYTGSVGENAIMTVEPGIYLESKFGVRIEDMVVVKKDGYENLTGSAKELIII